VRSVGSTTVNIRAAILAGGAASRLDGQPKGLLEVGGRRILDRVIDACIGAFGQAPLLIANAPEALSWCAGRLEVVPDVAPGAGPLGGLFTAVQAAAPVLCVAWDMPFVTAPLLRLIGDGLRNWDAFLPASDNRRGVEPLCAAYGPACALPMRAAIDRGDIRAVAFHPEIRIGILASERVAVLGPTSELFMNVNTADDLSRANRIASRSDRT
jgi:molybdenum cofactor guanylyltransferase